MAVKSFTVKGEFVTVSAKLLKANRRAPLIPVDEARGMAVTFAHNFRNRQMSGINALGRTAKPLGRGYSIFKQGLGKKRRVTYSRKIGYTEKEWDRARSKAQTAGRRFNTQRSVQNARFGGGIGSQRKGGKPIRDLWLTGEMWATFAVNKATPTNMSATFGKGRGARFGKGKAWENEQKDPFIGYSPAEQRIILSEVQRAIGNNLNRIMVRT